MLLRDRLLSWHNPMKRGWMGPGYCALCRSDFDIVDHIFIHCSSSKSVWKLSCEDLKVCTLWGESNIEEKLRIWHQEEGTCKLLHIFISWSVCNMRNKVIF